MAIVVVNKSDTFEEWRQKTNQISDVIGDFDELVNPDGSTSLNMIDTINKIKDNNLVMTIALGW